MLGTLHDIWFYPIPRPLADEFLRLISEKLFGCSIGKDDDPIPIDFANCQRHRIDDRAKPTLAGLQNGNSPP